MVVLLESRITPLSFLSPFQLVAACPGLKSALPAIRGTRGG